VRTKLNHVINILEQYKVWLEASATVVYAGC